MSFLYCKWSRDSRLPGRPRSLDDRGVAVIEFALAAPILMALLFGVMHFGSTAIQAMQMENAVRAGIQYASVRKPVDGNVSDIIAAVTTAGPDTPTDNRTVTATLFEDGDALYLTIRMEDDYRPPISTMWGGKSRALRAESTIRLK
ncbi:MAG: pilus assembly protein [Rhodospirillales bacterium]|nr:MAG: pilus assembly protein [Rhodospirillales bacterium]